MHLAINGEQREFPDGLTVAALVSQLGMKADRVAVELNLEIVPRAAWETTTLKNDDKLEVVHFVGGGSTASGELSAPSTENNRAAEMSLCPTCSGPLPARFCSSCGEKKASLSDLSMHHFFSHAMEEMFHFDSKILRTCRLLFSRPGFLTAEYLRGSRKPYLHPFQVFFIANLVYFLALPYIGWSGLRTTLYIQTHMMSYKRLASQLVEQRVAAKGVTLEQFSRSFDHIVDVQARSLVLVMVLLFAAVVAVLQWRKKQFFGQHLVFCLHFSAFWLVTLLTVLYGSASLAFRLAKRYGVLLTQLNSDNFLFPFSLAIMLLYAFLAFRTAYGDSVPSALLKAAVVTLSFHYILDVYRLILFMTAFYLA